MDNSNPDNLNFYFILKSGLELENVSSDMKSAFEEGQKYFELESNVKWVKETDCTESNLKSDELTKKHVFIFQDFSGIGFDYIKTTKALILGPRCLLSCLMENSSIPLGSSPVFTTAMRDLTICVSGLSNFEKINIKTLVNWMGGYFNDALNLSCTHLVSNTVLSQKYEKAASIPISIMHPDWIKDVWERSNKENVLAINKEFDKHKLPIFYNLNITTTALRKDSKLKIIDLIVENGGIYNSSFKSEITQILILESDMFVSEKYKAAMYFKKICLTPQWIIDSVEHGYSIEMDKYRVVNLKVSTPTKQGSKTSVSDFNADCTALSDISYLAPTNTTVNETCASSSIQTNASSISTRSTRSSRTQTIPKYKEILKNLSVTIAKKAGPFLDGCNIYLCGFLTDEKEKLNKILNFGSATRYDTLNEKVTHIILGEPNLNDFKIINDYKNTEIINVNLEWLQECIKEKQPAEEKSFLYNFKNTINVEPECASPASKKSIELMNNTFKKPLIPKLNLDAMQSTTKLVEQYLQANNSKIINNNTTTDSVDITNNSLFKSSKICILGFEIDDQQQLEKKCRECGATIVNDDYMGEVHFLILPTITQTEFELNVTPYEIFNDLWLEDVITENLILDKEYYYEPMMIGEGIKPLENMSIVTSSYSGSERIYITAIIDILGGNVEDTYIKKNKPLLVCALPEGAKYNAAIKWKLPVVTSLWVYDCAKQLIKLPYDNYLLTPNTSSIINHSININKTDSSTIDKVKILEKNNLQSGCDLNNVNYISTTPKTSNRKDVSKMSTPECRDYSEQILKELEQERLKRPPPTITPKNRRVSELITKTPKTDKNKKNLDDMSTPEIRKCVRDTIAELDKEILSQNSRQPPTKSRRLSEILPKTPTVVLTPDSPFDLIKSVKNLETPARIIVEKSLPYLSTLSPSKFLNPPAIESPEEFWSFGRPNTSAKTRQNIKRRLETLDAYCLGTQTESPKRLSTPFSEIKRRFWKEALGDDYVEHVKLNTQRFNEKLDDDTDTETDDIISLQSITHTSVRNQTATAASTITKPPANEPVEMLNNFIKNREIVKRSYDNIEVDSIPIDIHRMDSENICGTENDIVGWRDPTEFNISRRKKGVMSYKGTPYFIISCSNELHKAKLMKNIKTLNGKVIDNIRYDESCTHVICEEVNRGEKILSAIAAGKWVLSLKYIDDSIDAGFFLDEEYYEWGNDKATSLPDIKPQNKSLSKAALRWRLKIKTDNDNKAGVFTTFRVILHLSNRKEQFLNLIKAGGGTVLDVSPPYVKSDIALSATHCFLDVKKQYPLSVADHSALAESGVNVVTIMYLNDYLTSENLPDITKFMVSVR